MIKFLYYLAGLALIIYGVVMFDWFYDDFTYGIAHITNPQYFARIFAPITSVYLGLYYLYCATRNKISLTSKISFFILVIGLLFSIIIMSFTPLIIGGPIPDYVRIMDNIWRVLMQSSIVLSVFFSFLSFFKKNYR